MSRSARKAGRCRGPRERRAGVAVRAKGRWGGIKALLLPTCCDVAPACGQRRHEASSDAQGCVASARPPSPRQAGPAQRRRITCATSGRRLYARERRAVIEDGARQSAFTLGSDDPGGTETPNWVARFSIHPLARESRSADVGTEPRTHETDCMRRAGPGDPSGSARHHSSHGPPGPEEVDNPARRQGGRAARGARAPDGPTRDGPTRDGLHAARGAGRPLGVGPPPLFARPARPRRGGQPRAPSGRACRARTPDIVGMEVPFGTPSD